MDLMRIQNELNSAYQAFKDRADLPTNLAIRLSAPLLLLVSDRWTEARQRILIVGQETLGWAFDSASPYPWPYPPIRNFADFLACGESIEALTGAYRAFEFSRHQPKNHRSPFWSAYRKIRAAVNEPENGFETSVLWTNLFRMSLDSGSVIKNGNAEEIKLIRDSAIDLLRNEISILQPTEIIFFTGPSYDEHLKAQFPGIQFLDFCQHPARKASVVVHPFLPHAWRTYHPAYLSRSRDLHLVDEVIVAMNQIVS